jgi:hypothetical protein
LQTRQVVALVAVIAIIGLGLAITVHYISSGGTCSISGQPEGMLLRILSDSTLRPIIGAQVTATNQPAFCNIFSATKQTTVTFTTYNSIWYPLDGDNNAGYSFSVSYLGQNYSFKANLLPASVTCATLFIPSGRTNITTVEFQTTCM